MFVTIFSVVEYYAIMIILYKCEWSLAAVSMELLSLGYELTNIDIPQSISINPKTHNWYIGILRRILYGYSRFKRSAIFYDASEQWSCGLIMAFTINYSWKARESHPASILSPLVSISKVRHQLTTPCFDREEWRFCLWKELVLSLLQFLLQLDSEDRYN